jgi:hypothetical protein
MSDGIKIIEESWFWTFFAPDDWIRCNEDGLFDAAAFERQLSLLLEAKKNVAVVGSGSK